MKLKSLLRPFSSQLRLNMASGTVVAGVNVAVVTVSYPVYLHYLGLETYGLWVMLSVVLGFSRFALFGLPDAVVKLVAEESGRQSQAGVARYHSLALLCLLVPGLALVVVTLVFDAQIASLLVTENSRIIEAQKLIPYVGALSAYVFIAETANALLVGLGRMDLASLMQAAGRIANLAVSIFGLLWGWGLPSLLVGGAVGNLTVHLGSLWLAKRESSGPLFALGGLRSTELGRLLHFGSGTFGIWVLNMLSHPLNKLILSRFVGLEVVPIYDLAMKVGMQIRSFLDAGFRALVPEVSEVTAQGDAAGRQRVRRLYDKGLLVILGCGLLPYLLLWWLAPDILSLWLGERYISAFAEVLRIVLPGTFVGLLGVPAYYILLGMGRVGNCFFANVVQGGTNAILVVALLAWSAALSVQQVALAQTAAMVIHCLVITAYARRAVK